MEHVFSRVHEIPPLPREEQAWFLSMLAERQARKKPGILSSLICFYGPKVERLIGS
jgi:hypothetical protein